MSTQAVGALRDDIAWPPDDDARTSVHEQHPAHHHRHVTPRQHQRVPVRAAAQAAVLSISSSSSSSKNRDTLGSLRTPWEA